MLNLNVESNVSPQPVIIEACPDKTIVRLTDHLHQEEREDGGAYIYDEVVFDLPEGRSADPEVIADSFADWWLYGTEEHNVPTLEERVGVLEDSFGGIMDMLLG